jgi:hypothetical protein
MGAFVKQLECLNCSQSRSFVLHNDREQRTIGQAEAAGIAKRGVLTCGRCGSSSLILSWTDAVPYATSGRTSRTRRRAHSPRIVQES